MVGLDMVSRVRSHRHYPLAVALVGPLAAGALMIPLRTHAPDTDLALVMVVVVAVCVLPGRRAAALAAGLSAGVWFDFFLTRPYERFTISRSSDVQTTVLLAVVGILVRGDSRERPQGPHQHNRRPRRSAQPLCRRRDARFARRGRKSHRHRYGTTSRHVVPRRMPFRPDYHRDQEPLHRSHRRAQLLSARLAVGGRRSTQPKRPASRRMPGPPLRLSCPQGTGYRRTPHPRPPAYRYSSLRPGGRRAQRRARESPKWPPPNSVQPLKNLVRGPGSEGYAVDGFATPREMVMQTLCGFAVYSPNGSQGAKPADT